MERGDSGNGPERIVRGGADPCGFETLSIVIERRPAAVDDDGRGVDERRLVGR